jgi:hypothetical protein
LTLYQCGCGQVVDSSTVHGCPSMTVWSGDAGGAAARIEALRRELSREIADASARISWLERRLEERIEELRREVEKGR